MGHKPTKKLPPDNRDPGRCKETASGTADRRGSPGETLPPGLKSWTHDIYTVPAVCIFLLLAVAVVFGQTVHHGFVFDDEAYVIENPVVQKGLTQEGFRWALT